jgi:hypothetical protein
VVATATAVASPPPISTESRAPGRVLRLVRRTSWEAWVLWACAVAFIGVSAWWLTQDTRAPDYDSGFHMYSAFLYHRAMAGGNVALPFISYDSYPPLVHVLGAIAIFIAGMHPMALILSSNVVFVPLLAFACYGTGKIIAGRRAGLLAGVFALGFPMFVSMMHLYDLDPPQAAMVAVSVWGVLASRRFEVLNLSLAAGIACGLALMTKQTSVVFLGGFLVCVIARGGWRNRGGLLIFSLAIFDVAGIWYLLHFRQLTGTLTSIGGLAPNSVQAPPLWSSRNASWYFWDLINQQALVPLAAFFLAGCAIAVVRTVRSEATRRGFLPDLLVGALFSYIGMTFLTHKDPRYSLPALVYIAVIGTFWIPTLARPWLRALAATTLLAVAAADFIGMSFGVGGIAANVTVSLPGAQSSMISPGTLTLYQDNGWVRGGPERNGDPLRLLQQLRRAGVRTIAVDPSVNEVDFSLAGLYPLAAAEGISVVPRHGRRPADRYILLRTVRRGDPAPCQWLRGSPTEIEQEPGIRLGVYVLEGSFAGLDARLLRNPADPAQRYTVACPGRARVSYPPAAGA